MIEVQIVVLVAVAGLAMFIFDRNRAVMLRLFDQRTGIIVASFLGSSCLLFVYNRLPSESVFPRDLLAGAAFALLALPSLAPLALGSAPGSGKFRHRLQYLTAQVLWGSIIVLVGYWLANGTPPQLVRPILIAQILLLALLYQPRIIARIRISDQMPVSHRLFALAAALAMLLICIASPLAMYAASEDFRTFEVGVIGAFFAQLVLGMSVLAFLYALLDDGFRKILTIIFVFLSIMIFTYSGISESGLLDHFILQDESRLQLTTAQQFIEIVSLVFLFGLTALATIYLTRLVVLWTAVALISVAFTTLWVVYDSIESAERLEQGFPKDHEQIIGFSADRNVLVIMLDGFQGSAIEQLEQTAPEVLRNYDGFVWYPNTLTTNSGTWGAIGALVGGHRYTVEAINNRGGQSVAEAFEEAYAIFPDYFIPAGYDVTHVNPQYSGGCENLDPRVRCTSSKPYGYDRQHARSSGEVYDQTNLPLKLTMVSLFNAAPFGLKLWIYDRGNWLGTNDKDTSKYLFKRAEWNFLRALTAESHFRSDGPTFKFVQLQIPHWPFVLTADCQLDPKTASFETEELCAMRQIGVLLTRLKQAGVYHRTKIVLVSDHGWWNDNPMFPKDFEDFVPVEHEDRTSASFIHPLMLVKDFDSTGALARSDVFLSNADLPAILCSAIRSCIGIGPDPTSVVQAGRKLIVNITGYPANIASIEKFDVLTSYEVRESIFDARNWRRRQ